MSRARQCINAKLGLTDIGHQSGGDVRLEEGQVGEVNMTSAEERARGGA